MNKVIHISVVSPVYQAENIVSELVLQLQEQLLKITPDYEIILVNDASLDASWQKIVKECEKDTRIKGINLSRNFGQHYAITAGLSYTKGEWVVVMDCDLQDRPDEISNLYQKALEGWDIVYARRAKRKDRFCKRMSSKLFHLIFNYFSGLQRDETIGNFGIYHKKVIQECNKMKEVARAFGTLLNHVGFTSCAIDVEHAQRYEGKSSYSLYKLLKLSSDAILSNSNKPLKLTIKLGFLISFFSFSLALYNIIAHFIGIIKVPGFTTTIFSIWFVGGLMMLVLGIVSLYIGKIFDQVKERQLFIINDKINLDE